jgi:hypothetical protein
VQSARRDSQKAFKSGGNQCARITSALPQTSDVGGAR